MLINGIASIVVAYLIGSIPFAYIITRLTTGKDIRGPTGKATVGARNVYVTVGAWAGILVGILDMAKGVSAVVIAEQLLGRPNLHLVGVLQTLVLLAGVTAVAGHIWPVYIKFRGGNGLATSLGVLAVLLTRETVIVIGLTIVLIVFTRNPIFALNISLLSTPISTWLLEKSWTHVVFTVILLALMILHYLPMIKADLARTGSKEKFTAELLRIEPEDPRKGKKSKRKA